MDKMNILGSLDNPGYLWCGMIKFLPFKISCENESLITK